MRHVILSLILVVFICNEVRSQNDSIIIYKVSDFEYSFFYSAYTTIFDHNGASYLYTASNELGLVVFDISNITSPVPVDTFPPTAFGGLRLTNISQEGNYIYGSLGGFQLFPQRAGLAIFDVTNPANIMLTDVWDSVAFDQGCAIAISDGQYAYLGAMEEGVIILDVSNKNNVSYVSNIIPDPNFPQVPGIFSHPNARGMALRNDTLFLCYDAGGLRMLDVSNKFFPTEISKYVNRSLDSVAQPAYNNILLRGSYAYIPVDYCGLDIVDISDTAMHSVRWLNPWSCNNSNWQGRPGHTNQLTLDPNGEFLFVSGADSEVLVYDLRIDPTDPRFIGKYITTGDSIASWGLDVNSNYISLALLDNPSGVPYVADFGGIAILEWNYIFWSGIEENYDSDQIIKLFPNPANSVLTASIRSEKEASIELSIMDPLGRKMNESAVIFDLKNGENEVKLDISRLPAGCYTVGFNSSIGHKSGRFIKY